MPWQVLAVFDRYWPEGAPMVIDPHLNLAELARPLAAEPSITVGRSPLVPRR